MRVLGKRGDGFHEIETIFQQIDLHDVIRLELQKDAEETSISLFVNSFVIPSDDNNLAYRAAKVFLQQVKKHCRIWLHLNKHIPPGAGLGGGSSNAAAVLRALNNLFLHYFEEKKLLEMGRELGADVPFFLKGGCAYGTGIGDRLTAVAPLLSQEWIVVVVPPIQISSRWAYANLKIPLTNTRKNTTLMCFMERGVHLSLWREELTNEFEGVIFKAFPVLAEIKEKFYEIGAIYASLSGSGSAIYGIFDQEEDAKTGVGFFQLNYPTFLARPMRREL